MEEEYDKYRCSACKKAIKNQVVACGSCAELYYHPSCTTRHKICNQNREIVACTGPFSTFLIESDKGLDMKRTSTSTGKCGDRLESTGSVSEFLNIDTKIDWLIKNVKEMKDESACKKEIKMMIKEVVREEMSNFKQELEDLRKIIQEGAGGPIGGGQRSYSEATKAKKKENVIIIKPKMQQESETTKKLLKEKVDIKNMAMGITKLKNGINGTVIMSCDTGKELETLKATVQTKLGENYKIKELPQRKPKIKIINVGEDEMKLKDDSLMNTIKKQNRIEEAGDGFHMQIVKRITKETKSGNSEHRRTDKKEGSIIIETDEQTHDRMIKKEKLSVGWRKCPIFNHISVKRCFKCWGYYHIAKNCTRKVTCHKCAGEHTAAECKETKKRCVNCMFKIRTYNLKISDEHDAISQECPTFKRAMQEEKRRAGLENGK